MNGSALAVRALLVSSVLVSAVGAQDTCPRAFLPAYAHNDYENERPLADALALGYRGVEVDVFLLDGVLRVGHDAKSARRRKPFESVYLAPLRALVGRCGHLTADRHPFLVTIELKERSEETFDSLSALLSRYSDLFADSLAGSASANAVEAVLVGWHPTPAELARRRFQLARIQHLVVEPNAVADTAHIVRLVSLDYGKTVGRFWTSGTQRKKWLQTARAMKDAAPDRLLRVFNVPNDERVYRSLIAAGVDLIGTKTLLDSRRSLVALAHESARSGTIRAEQ